MATDVLVHGGGHGGMVITGVADRATERIAHLVYLDAAIPADRQSLVDIAGPLMAPARSGSRIVDGVEMCMYIDNKTIPYYGVHDPEQVEWMTARLTPHPWKCFDQPLRLTDENAVANGRFWELDAVTT